MGNFMIHRTILIVGLAMQRENRATGTGKTGPFVCETL